MSAAYYLVGESPAGCCWGVCLPSGSTRSPAYCGQLRLARGFIDTEKAAGGVIQKRCPVTMTYEKCVVRQQQPRRVTRRHNSAQQDKSPGMARRRRRRRDDDDKHDAAPCRRTLIIIIIFAGAPSSSCRIRSGAVVLRRRMPHTLRTATTTCNIGALPAPDMTISTTYHIDRTTAIVVLGAWWLRLLPSRGYAHYDHLIPPKRSTAPGGALLGVFPPLRGVSGTTAGASSMFPHSSTSSGA